MRERGVGQKHFTWRRLLVSSAAVVVVVLLVKGSNLRDLEALALAGLFALGLGLLRVRRGLIGAILLGLLFADVLAFMVLAVNSHLAIRSGLDALWLPASLTAVSLAGLIAAVVVVARRRVTATTSSAPLVVGLGTAVLLGALLAAGALGATPERGAAAEITLVAENTAFSQSDLNGTAGEVTVSLLNEDLFWHTFTIDELGVDLAVPVGGERTVRFEAPRGVYVFYCRIPGHREAGMVGSLIVQP